MSEQPTIFLASLSDEIDRLRAELERVKAERDAALATVARWQTIAADRAANTRADALQARVRALEAAGATMRRVWVDDSSGAAVAWDRAVKEGRKHKS